jgi:hypothetical protein
MVVIAGHQPSLSDDGCFCGKRKAGPSPFFIDVFLEEGKRRIH